MVHKYYYFEIFFLDFIQWQAGEAIEEDAGYRKYHESRHQSQRRSRRISGFAFADDPHQR